MLAQVTRTCAVVDTKALLPFYSCCVTLVGKVAKLCARHYNIDSLVHVVMTP